MPKKSTKGYKIGKFVIPISTQKEMDRQIKNTHNTNKEHGMSLCLNENRQIVPGFKSVGTEMGIMISEECKRKGERYIGSFHTHPDDSEAAASAQDLHSSCLRISNIDCVGKNDKGEILCYEKKNKGTSCIRDVKPLKDIEDVFHEIPAGQLPVIKDNLYAEVDRIAEQKFELHKIK